MSNRILKRTVWVFGLAILSSIALHLPMLGGIWGLISLIPLLEYFPEFERNSEHVEYGFLWLTLKTPYAWFVMTGYYLVLWGIVLGGIWWLRSLARTRNG